MTTEKSTGPRGVVHWWTNFLENRSLIMTFIIIFISGKMLGDFDHDILTLFTSNDPCMTSDLIIYTGARL